MNPLVQIWDKWLRWAERIRDDLSTTVDDRRKSPGTAIYSGGTTLLAMKGDQYFFTMQQFVRSSSGEIDLMRKNATASSDSCRRSRSYTDGPRSDSFLTLEQTAVRDLNLMLAFAAEPQILGRE